MKLALVAVLFAAASGDARADRLACETTADVAKRNATIATNNAKLRDAALAAAGLQLVAAPIAARGVQKQPAGNIVWIKLRVGCDTDVASEVVFAVDKVGKAYRVKPKTTYVEVPILQCGGRVCEPLCGMPPVEQSFAFRLPDKAVYSGEREVAWKIEIARISYDQPGTCGKNGQFTPAPATPAPATKPSAAPVSELDRLRAENAQLRAENAALKKQLQNPAARRAAENKKLEDDTKKLSKDLKN